MSNPTKWFHVLDKWNNVYDYVQANDADGAFTKFIQSFDGHDVEADDLTITEVEPEKVPYSFKAGA